MVNSVKKFFFRQLLLVLLMVVVPSGFAQQDSSSDPFEKVEQVTAQLLLVIDANKAHYPSNEVTYFRDLEQLLSQYIDFNYIAKKVMGKYAGTAAASQRERFEQKFRQGLVETYGRGLISYADEEIVLVDQRALKPGQRKVVVKQEIRGSGAVFPLEYHVARKKTGEWMVINVVMNGINLRKVFSIQFSNAAQQADGNMDTVIAGWTSAS